MELWHYILSLCGCDVCTIASVMLKLDGGASGDGGDYYCALLVLLLWLHCHTLYSLNVRKKRELSLFLDPQFEVKKS